MRTKIYRNLSAEERKSAFMPYESDRENMSAIEAVLFASGYPVKISMLADVLSLD